MESRVCISIVMPIYNCENYLDASISSVLRQDFKDFELILIDDGSKDGSWKVCQKYMEQDDRVRAFHTENRGVSGARNFGISVAEGEYLYFVDADDELLPHALEALLQPMRDESEIDVVIAYYDGTDTDVNKGDMPKGKYAIKDILKHILKNAPTFYYGVCWNKLYKTSLIREQHLKFLQGVVWSEDMLFNMTYLKYCETVYYTDNIVYYYNRNASAGNKIYTENFSFPNLINKLNLEKMRIKVLMELLQYHDMEKELLGWLHDFAINRMNQCFSDVFRIEKITAKVRKGLLIELVKQSEIKKILSGYVPQKRYLIENIYVWIVLKDHYNLLYFFSRLKFALQDNKLWNRFTNRFKSIWPKFSL